MMHAVQIQLKHITVFRVAQGFCSGLLPDFIALVILCLPIQPIHSANPYQIYTVGQTLF